MLLATPFYRRDMIEIEKGGKPFTESFQLKISSAFSAFLRDEQLRRDSSHIGRMRLRDIG